MPCDSQDAREALRSGRVFVIGTSLPELAPSWLEPVLEDFTDEVGDRNYPCYFGYRALRDGELFATWVEEGDSGTELATSLQDFLDATRAFPSSRLVLAAFFPPADRQRSHEWYGDRFWSVLRDLQQVDSRPCPDGFPASPQNSAWEFTFGGEAMFVFAAAPTHLGRRSRRLGTGLVMLFQPRNVFRHIEGGTPGGTVARRRIRSNLSTWDAVPPHPVMGEYGDESNFEWKQYFVADHDRPMEAICPLDPTTEACLHDLVTQQAQRTPDSPAVVSGHTVLDYRTLDRFSDKLAHRLVALGIQPDDRVAIVADRSVDTVVSMLAVLKAGASYLPLDPEYPEDRRAYLLDDAEVDVVLTPARRVASVPVGPRWILLSDELGEDHLPDGPPRTDVRPDNLAYVIYTSGSTGSPKGVAVSHRQIVASTHAQYAVERPWPEAFLMPISFSFDASAVGIFWTLTAGGCIVLPTQGEHRDPDALRAMIQQYGITHTDCTPALYDLVLGDDPTPLASLTCVQVGGETCPPALVRRHLTALPNCILQNNYGPTEATIWSTTTLFGPGSPAPSGVVPIGTPIPGARVHVLDADLRTVPGGTDGEMYVGGHGVARGYLNRPALTADRFVPDPFSGRPGARMYRTGDVARQLPSGDLDFIGRADTQVKVRGYRIELGEIESALRSHVDIVDAAVLVRMVATEPVLVGYVQPSLARTIADVTMISYLSARLPHHMVPRRWVRVDQIPHTISGKVDRRRLVETDSANDNPRSESGSRVLTGSGPATR